jgi:hypothetical protein
MGAEHRPGSIFRLLFSVQSGARVYAAFFIIAQEEDWGQRLGTEDWGLGIGDLMDRLVCSAELGFKDLVVLGLVLVNGRGDQIGEDRG